MDFWTRLDVCATKSFELRFEHWMFLEFWELTPEQIPNLHPKNRCVTRNLCELHAEHHLI